MPTPEEYQTVEQYPVSEVDLPSGQVNLEKLEEAWA